MKDYLTLEIGGIPPVGPVNSTDIPVIRRVLNLLLTIYGHNGALVTIFLQGWKLETVPASSEYKPI